MRSGIMAIAALALAACSSGQEHITSAVESDIRPEADTARDDGRHPAEILAFAGLESGWTVADLGTGGGYYARILSSAVGSEGRVFTQNFHWVIERFPVTDTALNALQEERDNVTYYTASATDIMADVDAPLDAVFMALVYHDTVWQQEEGPALSREERIAMNEEIFNALRPGGVLIVIDHHAVDGSGDEFVAAYHRVDEALVIDEITAAGFVLEETSDLLANPDDSRDVSVFDGSIRGNTDRFVHRYRRPL